MKYIGQFVSYLLIDNSSAKILDSHIFPEQKNIYMNIEQAWLSLRAMMALVIYFNHQQPYVMSYTIRSAVVWLTDNTDYSIRLGGEGGDGLRGIQSCPTIIMPNNVDYGGAKTKNFSHQIMQACKFCISQLKIAGRCIFCQINTHIDCLVGGKN